MRMNRRGVIELALTEKQEKFVYAYIETGNASEAYRRAYDTSRMKPTSVNRLAKALMDNVKIASRLNELRAPALEQANVTIARVIKELTRIAFIDMRAICEWGPDGVILRDSKSLTDDEAATVEEVSRRVLKSGSIRIKVSQYDKPKALELLFRYLGMFGNRAV